jgi:predicted secreted protein
MSWPVPLPFKAVALGQTLLHLDYKRSWETAAAPEKSFEVIVVDNGSTALR